MNTILLVVEDQPEIRKLICMTMDYDGFEVHEADNGDTGLRMVKALRPHIVLLDVMMPGQLDGIQVCERIRADPEIAHIPVVMLTARSQQTDLEAGRRAGCNAYLTKPFSPLQLIETVERLAAAETGR
ncbi:MAG TPA: response regulator [Thauera sp.]|jgi:CheY-like chemotaxis protein|uniref:response regulator transcription factor n=1 Tax=Thauera sp. TaxID=1905334 RepID=UPI000FA9E821|nr:response regulator [Thauera sp.]RTL20425.1 MAG: response regulator [Rhodocyclaceae bacterium]MCB1946543.1 response regulator [Thauera sp.]MCP5224640.1 response regulator [Thauera sp.]HNS93054.1 response regulator [Thauera sp.]HPE04524.1 response regulator [Thauera sp.]